MMNRGRKHSLVRAALIACVVTPFFGTVADAATVSYFLNQSNTAPPFPDGVNYLSLTIMDAADAEGTTIGGYTTTSADVVFTVSVLASLPPGTGFGIDQFAFNSVLSAPPASSNFALPTDWTLLAPGNADGFGQFELRTDTNGANDRLNPLTFAIKDVTGDTAVSYYELSSGNAGEGNYAYASHVAGLDAPGGVTSAWFAGPGGTVATVPLPGAVWLLGPMLAGLLGVRRRLTAAARE
jgi:hypothetical protein